MRKMDCLACNIVRATRYVLELSIFCFDRQPCSHGDIAVQLSINGVMIIKAFYFPCSRLGISRSFWTTRTPESNVPADLYNLRFLII